ncbi:MAG: HEAT repeat domain-containing protein [Planctomycetota bacterium]|nr:MAG: HEAT repeat domain-containing protein [Planctomycetota bacterium]MCQ3920294.1 hypothetical protein [Planctomycetota bacterium]
MSLGKDNSVASVTHGESLAPAGSEGSSAPAKLPRPQREDDSAATTSPDSENPPPMNLSLLARLFGVPLLIVVMIIGSAVLVVLLFGSITTEQDRSVGELLGVMEREPVGKVFDLAMMPQDKEIWQAAKELAARLQQGQSPMSAADLDAVVDRLGRLVDRDLKATEPLPDDHLQPLHFFMSALSHTGRPGSIAPLVRCLGAAQWQTRREALKCLGAAHRTEGARETAKDVAAALEDENATVRTVAAYVLSFLADPADASVRRRLKEICDAAEEDRELRWNAALTLARLGDDGAVPVLKDMLDRKYWEERAHVRTEGGGGAPAALAMSQPRIEMTLCASIEAAAHLEDETVWTMIAELEGDVSLQVRDRVRKALAGRGGAERTGPAGSGG